MNYRFCNRAINVEIAVLSGRWHIGFDITPTGYDGHGNVCLNLGLGLFSIYLGLGGKWLRALAHRLCPDGKDRSTSIRVFDSAIWLECWALDDWNCTDPWWMRWNWHPLDTILGAYQHNATPLYAGTRMLAMPERDYAVSIRMECASWKRPRWPFARTVVRADINCHSDPIPHPGKGENSWDCDQDATYSASIPAETPDEAIDQLRKSIMDRRMRYGGPHWRPRAA